ncbi:hypothetical protein [Simplicispira lacusdiani]|uniref:hypothetical protein n=1 Tax=Simplicispira lacusdiani TaxID=2213010 RepID=UPI000E73E3E8|nr:hypothetical protein [Simplicispira lacusdiani]
MAYLLLAALIVLVGVPAFRYLRGRMALAVAVLLPPVLFQAANWLYLGHLDPFWPIAVLVSLVASSLGAAVVGLAMDRHSHPREHR